MRTEEVRCEDREVVRIAARVTELLFRIINKALLVFLMNFCYKWTEDAEC